MVLMADNMSSNGFTAVNPTPASSIGPASAPASSTAGTKRKRESKAALKFYAVRVGKSPGIYHSWAECLDQVRGFPKAMFKSFTSLTDAENFVNNTGGSSEAKVTKYYGVQNGRNPGVYTSWSDVLEQITGWKGPKHKGFKTRTEAEQYVAEGQRPACDADVPVGSIEPAEPPTKKIKSKLKKGGVKDESSPAPIMEQGEYEPGEAPLGEDAEDGFDDSIVLDHTTNGARYKTREERESFTYQAVRPVKDAPIRIYTDGSSLGNGKLSAWGGVGVYFGPGDRRNISEPLSGTKQTNNRAELTAIIRALEVAPKDRRIVIVSDSKYAIDCVTDWFANWQRNGWVNSARKPVENKDLVQKILDMLEERFRLNEHRVGDESPIDPADKRAHWDRGPGGVRFEWVKGHDKDAGNTAADKLAVDGARSAQELSQDTSLQD
ncbi:Ribonuclease H [Fulvia fulva]|uniref:Ribonuclease H n=1 Tax=Passalora fulva TaxID=5499 RepID=A0A9Q8LAL2_PASFU|nr:Ribonuclease H [Fulvia fulva]KAK4632375.1 Ribonuclease H [Fulvia fulva]KAK4633124.1 Ribonuclease H [Fulvia fulva]UJO13908.1 Ribonuclease H [Fulvia fulva]WPV10552.1 Ribonuclease H [Fulvia fulva]WPV26101.1 Ribonuclease H [Fulvia fulva]